MIRPGKTIKGSTIPETLAELPKKEVQEPLVQFSIRIKQSTQKKLRQKSLDSGYSQQAIIDKALEAFLK